MPEARRPDLIVSVVAEHDGPQLQSPAEGEDGPASRPVRMNLNESPFPPSEKVVDAAARAVAHANRYPDNNGRLLIAELGRRSGIPHQNIHLGCGSSEILIAAIRATIGPGDAMVQATPTFGVCANAARIAGGDVVDVPVRQDGSNDIAAMLQAVTPQTRVFYVCTPNNPTGGDLSPDDLERAIREVPDTVLLLIDEAYVEFAIAEGGADSLSFIGQRTGPWLITRTFSKAYCLSGLRIGYGFSSPGAVATALQTLRPAFTISRPALAAGRAALSDGDHIQSVLARTIAARDRLAVGLAERGFEVLPSRANFVTARPPRHRPSAKAIAIAMEERGFLLQVLPWPDEQGSLRLTVALPEDNERFLRALDGMTDDDS